MILVPDIIGPREAIAKGYKASAPFLVVSSPSQPGGSDDELIYRTEGGMELALLLRNDRSNVKYSRPMISMYEPLRRREEDDRNRRLAFGNAGAAA